MEVFLVVLLRIIIFLAVVGLSIITGYGLFSILLDYRIVVPSMLFGINFILILCVTICFLFYGLVTIKLIL